ncbi:hypothetical protein DPMN_063711 [Dreissena polymorpha]|uniref:ATP-dependent DNA helicase n=1 Tax=Dreissena polymorpha TaxID=45954 RepID=A0A9D4CB11_DREPO|nr:hypothetical protein DPMN_063711 [Dreissena polymorpha]
MDFKSDLEYATSKLKIEFSFSDYQLKALKSLYDLKDTIAVLLTGSGKALFFRGSDFCKAFNRLGDLTCLFPKILHLALTATATPNAIENLIESLQFKNTTKVLANPDFPNIFWGKIRKNAKYSQI